MTDLKKVKPNYLKFVSLITGYLRSETLDKLGIVIIPMKNIKKEVPCLELDEFTYRLVKVGMLEKIDLAECKHLKIKVKKNFKYYAIESNGDRESLVISFNKTADEVDSYANSLPIEGGFGLVIKDNGRNLCRLGPEGAIGKPHRFSEQDSAVLYLLFKNYNQFVKTDDIIKYCTARTGEKTNKSKISVSVNNIRNLLIRKMKYNEKEARAILPVYLPGGYQLNRY